ncbi:MAG: hypothetical protein LYZ66_01970 [Nitrososphaerales archaeon]|nr:hypothetical protein [Nitrososphaerales archaeon]
MAIDQEVKAIKEVKAVKEEKVDPSLLVREMRDTQSEAAQLSEIEELEYTQAQKLVESMKVLQESVETAINIRPQSLGEPLLHSRQAIIGSDAVIIGLDVDGKPFSKPLSSLHPRDILAVVGEWTPRLREKILERKKESENRLYLIEKALHQFKEGASAIKDSRKQFLESVESDLVRDTLEKE